MTDTLRVTAPAKINLYLEAGGVRPDGYHEVRTVLQALELADEVLMAPAQALSVVMNPDHGIPAEANLAYRAARMLGDAVGASPAFAITVEKHVPTGAGLGGGSSDAAAVLAGLAAYWDLALDDPRLLGVAAGLGADVPFFLRGGTALYEGRGDRFVRSMPTLPLDVVLVKPAPSVPTAAAYAAFDSAPRVPSRGVRDVGDACRFRNTEALGRGLFNNMTTASVTLVPEIADVLAWLDGSDGVFATLMCGSGSAVFGLCSSAGHAASVAGAACDLGWWAAATRTRDTGVQVEWVGEEDRG